jgi:hypothetical protein
MRARDPGPSRETTWHALPLDEPADRTNGHLCTFCVNFFFGGLGGAQRHFFDETKLWVPTSTTLAIHNGGNEMKWLCGRWPGCGACPRHGFAARGSCGPSPGVLRGRIYLRPKWGEGRRRRRRSACRGRNDRHGLASLDGLLLTESVPRTAAAAPPTAGRLQRILGKMFGARRHARHANPPSADGE